MSQTSDFNFADQSIAENYDQVLVPALFDPWTKRLIEENQPWASRYVLDLACGTGAVTKQLLNQVKCSGELYALDLNQEMLEVNRAKFEELGCDDVVKFIHAPADAIPIEDNRLDIVVCQQGFQFFPDQPKVAREIYRVLNAEGRVLISTWLPVTACPIMETLCEALENIGESEMAASMRKPFDFMPKETLQQAFDLAGFRSVEIKKQALDIQFAGGLEEALSFVLATPIGPQLKTLSTEQQLAFKHFFKTKVRTSDGTNFGPMTTHVLKAHK